MTARTNYIDNASKPYALGSAALLRGKQDERPYCLSGECYPASNRCLIEMLLLPHAPGAKISKTYFLIKRTACCCGSCGVVGDASASSKRSGKSTGKDAVPNTN